MQIIVKEEELEIAVVNYLTEQGLNIEEYEFQYDGDCSIDVQLGTGKATAKPKQTRKPRAKKEDTPKPVETKTEEPEPVKETVKEEVKPKPQTKVSKKEPEAVSDDPVVVDSDTSIFG